MNEGKAYTVDMVKQKNGRTVPITKRTKPCPVCGQNMLIKKHKKGGVHKRALTKWECTDTTTCKHSEIDEGSHDFYVRVGVYDEEIGILETNTEDNGD